MRGAFSRLAIFGLAWLGTLLGTGAASGDPNLTVPRQELRAALHCTGKLETWPGEPVLLLPGTGSDGADLFPTGFQVPLRATRSPSCYVNLPEHALGDMQIAAQYTVFALRTMAKRAHRPVAVYGFSQGGVIARLALTFWPSTRRLVTDVVAASSPQHGSSFSADCAQFGCPAALWQRLPTSRLLAALNRHDETPGPTAWTTLRTLDDTIALPVNGSHPTSVLRGAGNLLIQRICPGRHVEHLGMAFDAVAFAALRDAMTHPGAASGARLRRGHHCSSQFVGKLSPANRRAQIAALNNLIITRNLTAPRLSAEPPVTLAKPRG